MSLLFLHFVWSSIHSDSMLVAIFTMLIEHIILFEIHVYVPIETGFFWCCLRHIYLRLTLNEYVIPETFSMCYAYELL